MRHQREIDSVLHRLPAAELRRARTYIRFRWFVHKAHRLPLPIKLGLFQGVLVLGIISTWPVQDVPPLALPIAWIGAYVISLGIVMLSPTARQRYPAHWVNSTD